MWLQCCAPAAVLLWTGAAWQQAGQLHLSTLKKSLISNKQHRAVEKRLFQDMEGSAHAIKLQDQAASTRMS